LQVKSSQDAPDIHPSIHQQQGTILYHTTPIAHQRIRASTTYLPYSKHQQAASKGPTGPEKQQRSSLWHWHYRLATRRKMKIKSPTSFVGVEEVELAQNDCEQN